MKHLCDYKDCCGCMSCVFTCNQKAICVKQDKCGFFYPEIDINKCVDCGLCDKSCPILNNEESNPVSETLGARYKDISKVIKSTSGGLATYFAEKTLENNGVVYGVAYNNLVPVYTRIDDIASIEKIRGTKYTEPRKDFWDSLSTDLKHCRKVLFIGTPCTVAAVKNKFRNSDGLYTCELVCHGITSQRVLEEYKTIKENKHNSRIISINLRYKKGGIWDPPYLRTEYANQEEEEEEFYFESLFGYAFLNMSRESCYNCKFKGDKSCADITIGDYWGVSKDSEVYAEQGVSLLLCRTDKGKEMIDFDDQICYEMADYNKVIVSNYPIVSPTLRTKENQQFVKRFKRMNLCSACLCSPGFIRERINRNKIRVKRFVKKLIG